MPEPRALAVWLLEQESRALLSRLDRIKPFALQETMVPAASLLPPAALAIDNYLLDGRRRLRADIQTLIAWLRGPGRSATPAQQQRRFTVVRLAFNTALAQLDLFADAITQRSEAETGVWLSGLDVAAQDALRLPGAFYDAPPVVCYLDRGLGGAIRRARTRLPGGGENPAAIIRIPRERMIGFGIASSLVHEVGHQGAALLDLVASLKLELSAVQAQAPQPEKIAWKYWEKTISEVVADFWALAKVGVASTLGLIGIVSLPRPFVFRINLTDPHPFPWIRVMVSCAIGKRLYPHVQWDQLAATWETLYPTTGLAAPQQQVIAALRPTIPVFADLLANHRPASLAGASLGEIVAEAARAPNALIEQFERWQQHPNELRNAAPTMVFAAFGRARISGRLAPEREEQLLGRLITQWALSSTFAPADRIVVPGRGPVAAPAAVTPRPAAAARIA
jgi:hypothetical protein